MSLHTLPSLANPQYRTSRIGYWIGRRIGAVVATLEPVDAWLSTRRYLLRAAVRQGVQRARCEAHRQRQVSSSDKAA